MKNEFNPDWDGMAVMSELAESNRRIMKELSKIDETMTPNIVSLLRAAVVHAIKCEDFRVTHGVKAKEIEAAMDTLMGVLRNKFWRVGVRGRQ